MSAADEGLPVLGPGTQQGGDQESRSQHCPDDPVPAAGRPLRDGPPPPGDAEREPGHTERDVHTIADQEADHRDGEEQDRDERKDGEKLGLELEGCDSIQPCVVTSSCSRCASPRPVVLVSPGRRSLRCRWGVAITVHHFLVLALTAL